MLYEVKAYRAPDGVTILQLEAADAIEAARQAEAQGYRMITVRRKLEWSARIGSRQRFSLALFSQEVLALLEAGLSLIETIDILSRKSQHSETKKILEAVARYLREGLSFSRALEKLPRVFPSLYIATVRTSEHTGDLTEALRRYLAYHRQLNAVRDKVVSASVYPALLLIVGILVVLFLLGYVVPRFSKVYEDLGGNLPWLSQILMQWGHLFSQHAGWVMGCTGLLIVGAIYGLTRSSTRTKIEHALWSIPAIGERLRLYQLARFTRTLAMLVNGGIPFVAALDMVSDLLRQPALRQGLNQAAQLIREGRAVSGAFAANNLATEVAVRLLIVGERSGELGQAMERIAKLYDDEIARWVEWFSRLFEPLLMIAIGLIIGIVVLLMYLPIFELASSIQ